MYLLYVYVLSLYVWFFLIDFISKLNIFYLGFFFCFDNFLFWWNERFILIFGV